MASKYIINEVGAISIEDKNGNVIFRMYNSTNEKKDILKEYGLIEDMGQLCSAQSPGSGGLFSDE